MHLYNVRWHGPGHCTPEMIPDGTNIRYLNGMDMIRLQFPSSKQIYSESVDVDFDGNTPLIQ